MEFYGVPCSSPNNGATDVMLQLSESCLMMLRAPGDCVCHDNLLIVMLAK